MLLLCNYSYVYAIQLQTTMGHSVSFSLIDFLFLHLLRACVYIFSMFCSFLSMRFLGWATEQMGRSMHSSSMDWIVIWLWDVWSRKQSYRQETKVRPSNF